MTIFRHLFLILLFVLTSPAQAVDSWAGAADWTGKYPSDKLRPNGPGLLDYPPIKTALRKVVPKTELLALKTFDVETPVRRMGDYLVLSKCLPHNCPADNAMVVIDLKSERIWAGFFTREEHRISTRWYGNVEEYTVLPDEIRAQFQASH